MVRASKGFRAGTRRKLSRGFREKFTVTPYMREFKLKDKVVIKIEPSSHRGMPYPKFKGMVGEVAGTRGGSFLVRVRVGGKVKEVIARPEHLKPTRGG